jgi:hypothetical protein
MSGKKIGWQVSISGPLSTPTQQTNQAGNFTLFSTLNHGSKSKKFIPFVLMDIQRETQGRQARGGAF